MLGRRSFLAGGLATGLLPAPAALAADPSTQLFYYPAPRIYQNGDIVFSPVTAAVEQITTGLPETAQMSGVVCMIAWSDIARAPAQLDLGPFEQILDYWHARNRAVVIGVVTVGYPVMRDDPARRLGSATPDWVLAECATYRQDVRVLGPARTSHPYRPQVDAVLPVYWDARFQQAVTGMVRTLARLDGHPALAKVRISLGIETEDNPTFDGLRAAMPGWSNAAWISYCRKMTDLYLSEFRRTGVEFDIDRLGYVAAIGTNRDRDAASALLDYLHRAEVFLAMDGLDTNTARAWLAGGTDGPSRSIDALVAARAAGGRIGLETTVFAGKSTAAIDPIAELLARIRPDRLVLNADVAASLASTPSAAAVSLFGRTGLAQGASNFHTAIRGLRLARQG